MIRLSETAFAPLIGLPYKAGGRDAAGCDCWGLVVMAFGLAGITLTGPDSARVRRAMRTLVRSAAPAGDPCWRRLCGRDLLQQFDLALMTDPAAPGRLPGHVGVLVSGGPGPVLLHAEDCGAGSHLAPVHRRDIAVRIVSWHRHQAFETSWEGAHG